MTATTATKSVNIRKVNVKEFIATALEKSSEVIADMVITVLVLGVSIAYMFNTVDHVLLNRFIGLYITGMMVQLMIRIVHRFDDHYTTDELAERVIELEQSVHEQLDRIEQNV
jgi:hypothetical protein